jgi:hypothetical protein
MKPYQARIIAGIGFGATVLASAFYILPLALVPDVAGFLLDARAFREGRHLYESFFEINAPSNVWLPMLSLWISSFVPWTLGDIHQTLLFLFTVLCSGLTVWLTSQRIGNHLQVTLLVVSVLVPAIFIWLPHSDFGEREHLFLAAMGPFTVIVGGRHMGIAPSPGTAIGGAALAAFGAASKPHFMLMAGLFVFADLCLRRGRLRELGGEAFALVAFLAAYVVWIVVIYPRYYTEMLPTALATYFTMRADPWTVIGVLGGKRVAGSLCLALVLMSFLVFLRPPNRRYWDLTVPFLWLVLIVLSAGVYIGQSFGFDYQQVILIALLIVGNGIAIAMVADRFRGHLFHRLPWLREPADLLVLAAIVLGGSALVLHALGAFQLPLSRQAAVSDPMTRIMVSLPRRTPVLMLQTGIAPISPLHAYADVRWTGAYSTLLVLRAIYNERDRAAAQSRPVEPNMVKVEQDVRHYVLESFAPTPPEIVFVETSQPLAWFEDYPKAVSLIDFFSEQPAFATEWRNYEKIDQIRVLKKFDVAVYRRRKDGQ